MKKILSILFVVVSMVGYASNLQITHSKIDSVTVGTSTAGNANDYVFVQFDMSWEYSWRDSENWDAVWVFVKFYDTQECRWRHAWLSNEDNKHSVGTNNGVDATINVGLTKISDSKGAKGMGVFAFRTSEGSGTVTWEDVRLRWEYANQEASIRNVQKVKVFGFEMVYVPEGSYYLGDGNAISHVNQFHRYGSGDPFYVNSNTGIHQGHNGDGFTANYCCYLDYRCISWGIEGTYGTIYNDITLPDSYAKGYNAVYCMKTLVTQNMYCEFLNTCRNISPENNRFPNGYYGEFRFNIDWDGEKFICNASGRGTGTEADDGGWVACNYMEPADMLAFLDWAALRPMTEMEFEKIARGVDQVPTSKEYAWGNTNITPSASLKNKNTANEYYAVGNCHYGQGSGRGGLSTETADYPIGPCRPGSFAKAGSTREAAGAGIYGTFDMSGNLWDLVVGNFYNWNYPDSSSVKRFSQWVHGDGELGTTGTSDTTDVVTWLTLAKYGPSFGKKGGSFYITSNTTVTNDYNTGVNSSWNTGRAWFEKGHNDLFISGRGTAIFYNAEDNGNDYTWNISDRRHNTCYARYHKGYENTTDGRREYWYNGAFDQGFRGVRTSPEYTTYE